MYTHGLLTRNGNKLKTKTVHYIIFISLQVGVLEKKWQHLLNVGGCLKLTLRKKPNETSGVIVPISTHCDRSNFVT